MKTREALNKVLEALEEVSPVQCLEILAAASLLHGEFDLTAKALYRLGYIAARRR